MKENQIIAVALRNEMQLYELIFRKSVLPNFIAKDTGYEL